jgi:regulator of sirC expression with transglutaminase-like and TPR domain
LQQNKQITALLHLIDDPDEEVYSTVSNKIISFGKEIIPNLEELWENTINESIQERIESIIHKLHFKDLTTDFIEWRDGDTTLLKGALLASQYHFPEAPATQTLQDLEKIRRNIWIELNQYLTPLEQVNVFNSILYSYYKQKGVEISYTQPEDFLLSKTVESKKGNAISNGILYLILCDMLDIPVRAINIPRQFILGYIDTQYDIRHPHSHSSEKIKFYIDPLNGQIYSHKDVENYFKRINVPPTTSFFKTLDNKFIIQYLLEELSKCYDTAANQYKMEELIFLAKLLSE